MTGQQVSGTSPRLGMKAAWRSRGVATPRWVREPVPGECTDPQLLRSRVRRDSACTRGAADARQGCGTPALVRRVPTATLSQAHHSRTPPRGARGTPSRRFSTPMGPAPASRFPSNQKARPSETPPLTDSPLANERPRPAPSAHSPRGAGSEREERTQPVGAAAPDPPAPRPPPPPPGRVYCPNPKVQFCGPAAASERAR